MRPCVRGPEPPLLAAHGAAMAADYVAKRAASARHRFQWRRIDGEALLDVVRAALRAMTDARCSYCDGHPIDALGEEQVDHFQPKTDPRFHHLVCTWTNLFLTCMRCNKAKGDRWEAGLLRPDDHDYRFERYFEYRFDSGMLLPNAAAPAEEQERARRTIELLDLNRKGACEERKRTVRRILRPDDEAAELPYRYLLALCVA